MDFGIKAKWDCYIKILKITITKNQYYTIQKKKNQRKRIIIADDLYDQVIDFKNFKIENGKYNERSLTTSTGKTLTGHFVFDLTRSKLQKKFSRKFKN